MQHLAFCAWLHHLMYFFLFIYLTAHFMTSFFFTAEQNSIMCLYHISIIQSSGGDQSSSEHGCAGVSLAVCSPSSICAGTAESCGRSGCSSWRAVHTDFHSVSVSLPPASYLSSNFVCHKAVFQFQDLNFVVLSIIYMPTNYPVQFWARPLS